MYSVFAMLTRDDLKVIATKNDLFAFEKRLTLLIQKSTLKLGKEIKLTRSSLDSDVTNLHKRMDRVEDHLNLPPNSSI